MYYRKWTEDDIERLSEDEGIVILYTEIDLDGNVRREIGLNNEGKVIHKCPSELYRYGTYGLFDNQKVLITESRSLIKKEEFERLWEL
jgi:hypothetical protein